mgnify:CR=1 FL=1
MKLLRDILPQTVAYKIVGDDSVEVLRLELDSRKVEPGSLFFAIPGTTVDGHDFIDKAIELGAVAIVAERQTVSSDIPFVLVDDAAQAMLQTLMEKEEEQLNDPFTRIFALGLGLLFLGQQAKSEASMEVCKLIQNQKFADFVELVLETCAYAGSGNVLKVQKMLHLCAEHKTDDKETLH